MHDNVAGVDQDPVAGWHALDTRLSMAPFLDGAQQVICHGADMAVRTARGDNDGIGDRAFVF